MHSGASPAPPCYSHPDYVNFWLSTVEDLFRTYPYLAGIYCGSENLDPLPTVLSGGQATCFCEHCRRLARERGVDPERARSGYVALQELVAGIGAGRRASDGASVEILSRVSAASAASMPALHAASPYGTNLPPKTRASPTPTAPTP